VWKWSENGDTAKSDHSFFGGVVWKWRYGKIRPQIIFVKWSGYVDTAKPDHRLLDKASGTVLLKQE